MGRHRTKRTAPPKHKTNKKVTPKQTTQKPSSKPHKLRQKQLSFEPATNDSNDPENGAALGGGGRMEPFPTPKSNSIVAVVVTTPSNHDRYQYYNASPLPFPKLTPITSPAKEPEVEDMDDLEDTAIPVKNNRRKRQRRIDELFNTNSSPTPRRRSRMIVSDDSESDTLDNIITAPPPAKQTITVDGDEEEEEQEENQEENQEEGEEDSDDSEEEAIIIRPGARRQQHTPTPKDRYRTPTDDDDDDDDDDEELREEARDLTSSARKNSLTADRRTRDAQSRNKRKSQFQKQLDSLKKRKQGLEHSDEEAEEEEEEVGKKKAALYDSDSDVESVASKDFVVEDDGTLGLEELLEIPPEFTSLSYQGPQLNFKVVVQAEVYALLHPAYRDMDYSDSKVNPYFTQAFKSLERQVMGITDSAISSNAWKPWFIKALKSRPEFESENIPGDIAECDACNTRKRHATYLARLTGPKYNPRTLQIIAPANESFCYWGDDDKQFLHRDNVPSDPKKMAEQNIKMIPLDREWALGVFCHDRAEIAHYFYHWRYHLREQIKLALMQIGRFSQFFKDYICGLSSEMQDSALEQVMDTLDSTRHIARMYKDHRNKIAQARDYLTGSRRGWQSSPKARRFVRS